MYYLYKLKFTTPVHFGDDKPGISLEKNKLNCSADTFFSAICQEIIKLYGEEKLNNFIEKVKTDEILFTDLFPYENEELFLPKPIISIEKTIEQTSSSKIKKKMKKLEFIPLSKFSEFTNFLKNGGEIPEIETEFSKNILYEKVSLPRDAENEDNKLYSVGVNVFKEDCGLYFVIKSSGKDNDFLNDIITSLGLSGIGGKRTSGYGKFEILDSTELIETSGIESERKLFELLSKTCSNYMTLSCFFPKKEEIEKLPKGFYGLIKRAGFVSSTTYSSQLLKKIPITMVKSGSCFPEKFDGEIADVSFEGNHPVYRYGKPIMIGFEV